MKHIPPSPPPENTHAQKLATALHEMDRFVQQGCAEVSALAQLALAWLEIPEGHQRLDVVAQALVTIRNSAESLAEFAGSEARVMNCEYEDQAEVRRSEAAKVAAEEAGHVYTVVGPGVAR